MPPRPFRRRQSYHAGKRLRRFASFGGPRATGLVGNGRRIRQLSSARSLSPAGISGSWARRLQTESRAQRAAFDWSSWISGPGRIAEQSLPVSSAAVGRQLICSERVGRRSDHENRFRAPCGKDGEVVIITLASDDERSMSIVAAIRMPRISSLLTKKVSPSSMISVGQRISIVRKTADVLILETAKGHATSNERRLASVSSRIVFQDFRQ